MVERVSLFVSFFGMIAGGLLRAEHLVQSIIKNEEPDSSWGMASADWNSSLDRTLLSQENFQPA